MRQSGQTAVRLYRGNFFIDRGQDDAKQHLFMYSEARIYSCIQRSAHHRVGEEPSARSHQRVGEEQPASRRGTIAQPHDRFFAWRFCSPALPLPM